MSVTRTLLPRNSNLAIAQAAATPNTRLSGTAIEATRSVRRIAASASGSANEAKIGRGALRERLDENGDERQDQEEPEKDDRDGDQEPARQRLVRW